MRAGQINKQISIRYPISTARSTDGAPIVTTGTLLSDIWARAEPQTGSEVYRDRNRWDVDEIDFYIRYTTATVTNQMWIDYKGNDYDIKAVINVDERDREIQIMTKRHS
jgi:SPP1 family predicted phage head-tail adaptor